ncbi:bifunctional hydroxymethylpyrimidine kinase/phosphomethylpyrimidine kinase [Lentilactobacillus laojiaonis]|uniref:bifunctional hydroxymethylpyrimidine kinase/phosphomethylpyrimidine kinase n=1 Tax=Lentilactobacillus laojiaonis TaxID=2883998 RepID=UPI001D0A41F9|nr:bifunctional hydroxymethylpyrimidine kinase/phosphomethylpyrimidine kinase [Lentilactobacillus laojiaonis]UDM32256.1 bifunctional hydroxymethylpyrimidine kinase/phosphomethylpyrimidine kinase [Lentilactobacillus laojiaonis]
MLNQIPQAVTIAGSDSDGSAGMQADLHTFFRHEVYGASILTACVAGNSFGIHDSVNLPTSFIDSEFKALAEDYQIKAAKTGMLSDSKLINTVVTNYKKYNFGPLVVDPVITTKHGNELLDASAYQTLRDTLIPLAYVITPNFFEAQKLAEMSITSEDDIKLAAQKLQQLGAKNIVIKGAHNDPNQTEVKDYVLLEDQSDFWLTAPYHPTDRVNGTGDTLSASITAELAKGASVEAAIRTAKRFVDAAIANEIIVGHKFGPINHWAKF